ncbi:MAG: 23S rRNA (adenine(2503)-C(2))-methyltransferase RlmN [Gemmatimonadota bacterium]
MSTAESRASEARPNLLGLEPDALHAALREHFAGRGQPGFRAGQTARWILEERATSFEAMTDLPAAERAALAEAFSMEEPALAEVQRSRDGTTKHLWRLADGELVESVLIPARDRLTLCISSQAGCAVGCTFCATGWSGFRRQLDTAEIVGQYRASQRWADENDYGRISNVVFMGMGEPLANRKGVFPALTLLNAGYGLGARKITISTVGLVPGLQELARRPEQFTLALSLHAPNSALRRELIPMEKRYPLADVMAALEAIQALGGRRVTFEYTMIRDVNDAPELAPELARLARSIGAFVNLIPFNPIPWQHWKPSEPARIRHFQEVLERAGVMVAVREPRGRDIDAACGQLRANVVPMV